MERKAKKLPKKKIQILRGYKRGDLVAVKLGRTKMAMRIISVVGAQR
jgi:predicted SnoaL-like aldol condensation-catalyzing enzyme